MINKWKKKYLAKNNMKKLQIIYDLWRTTIAWLNDETVVYSS